MQADLQIRATAAAAASVLCEVRRGAGGLAVSAAAGATSVQAAAVAASPVVWRGLVALDEVRGEEGVVTDGKVDMQMVCYMECCGI